MDKFNPNIYKINIDRLIYELNELSHKKLRFFKNKQHIELVERFYNYPVNDDIPTIINDLNQAKIAIKLKKSLEANEALAKKYYGDYWHLNADINDLKSIAQWMTQFTSLTKEGIFSQNTIDVLSKDLFDINPERDLVDYIDSGNRFSNDLEKLKSKLNPRSKLIFKKGADDVAFEDWQSQLYNWRGQLSSLHLWSQYLNTKNSLKGTIAELFVDSIEKRNIKKYDIKALVEGNFADSLLNILFVENHELATFIGELHENRIREFKDLDRKILVLNRKRIFHKLNSNIPQIFGATENPQAKVLAGEFTRKSGHLPVRKLLEKAGGMIKQIKPCFMMSPLSVAQYLDPTNEELQFDVVIFDEASQVKPEDALGAFMRGKTAVVMGDTQQLPPTSFFDQMSSGESDEEEATSLDMESILHLCKLSFPVKMLKWHYRSRHESLISVSNKEFYDNELLVYPSPSHNDPELGLKFHYNPNTAYDRGSSSANPKEAEDVVEAIFEHFDKYGDTKSLGVGTFSVAQKNAILEKLEEKRRDRPELEPLFSENKDERFFVKNLETIQGDERDVILISVGYGFDNERKMSLNFGPLNQDGGERRLNVLITRARQKCVVFSNFKASSMKLTANPPHGVRALREFLEYAENLTIGAHTPDEHSQAPFEDAIASFLEENGYQVDRQIGCAGFRVDLAIVDEENPGKYILGITTDGKMYASSKVARDRDRLREQVLEGLGWKLYHLWSTDWYRNRDLGRKKLLDFIEKSIKETREEQRIAREKEEKRRIEAEKRAEELRKKREKELEEQKRRKEEAEAANLGENVEVIPPDALDFDDDIIFVSKDEADEFNDNDDLEFVESESPSEFVEVTDDEDIDEIEIKSPSEFVEIDDDSSAFDDFIFKDDSQDNATEKTSSDIDGDLTEEKTIEEVNDDKGIDEVPSAEESPDDDIEDEILEEDNVEKEDEIDLNNKSDEVSSHDIKFGGADSLNDVDLKEDDSDEVNVDEILDELSDEEDLDGVDDEDTFIRDKDSNEDAQSTDEEVQEEVQEEIDDEEEPDSYKINFGSTLSKVTEGSILSSIKDKFSKSNAEDEEAGEMDATDIIKDKLEDDDFIYVDHSNDEESIVDYSDVDDDLDLQSSEENMDSDIIDEEPIEDSGDEPATKQESVFDEETIDVVEQDSVDDSIIDEEPIESEIKEKPKVKFNTSTDSIHLEDIAEDTHKEVIQDKETVDFNPENIEKEHIDSNMDDDYISVESDEELDDKKVFEDDKVDLGSDDDYIYVDHSNDEESIVDYSDDEPPVVEVNPLKNILFGDSKPKNQNGISESRFSEAIKGTSKLNLTKEEVKTVHGEIIDDDIIEHEHAPEDDDVIEAEIVTEESKRAFYNDKNDEEEVIDIPINENKVKFKRNIDGVSEMKGNRPIREKDFNRILDETFDNNPEGTLGDEDISNLASALVNKAFDDVISEAFNDKEDERSQNYNENPQTDYEEDDWGNEYEAKSKSAPDGVTYYEGISDVQSPLKKNNLYYDEDKNKNKSVKDSIKSGIRDIKYIRKSLNEIENPTPVGYVSVVDRTEEYDVNDYVEPIQDYEGEEYVPEDEGLTFAEKEELRYERELKMEKLKKELSDDENTIVTIHEEERREDRKDQALEDIIQIADEDYKEIEKERFKSNNTLKAFDDNKLPKRGNIEDEIVEYKFASGFGLNSQKDLFDQPIGNVSNSITEIVNVEGPIHVDEVVKRVKDSCNIKRAGSKMKKQVSKAIKESENSGNIIRIGDFLYDASSNDVVIRKRVKPNIDLISDEEIEKNIETILSHKQSLPTATLTREVSRNFGFKSTSRKTSVKIKSVLDSMIADGSVKLDKDIVELN